MSLSAADPRACCAMGAAMQQPLQMQMFWMAPSQGGEGAMWAVPPFQFSCQQSWPTLDTMQPADDATWSAVVDAQLQLPLRMPMPEQHQMGMSVCPVFQDGVQQRPVAEVPPATQEMAGCDKSLDATRVPPLFDLKTVSHCAQEEMVWPDTDDEWVGRPSPDVSPMAYCGAYDVTAGMFPIASSPQAESISSRSALRRRRRGKGSSANHVEEKLHENDSDAEETMVPHDNDGDANVRQTAQALLDQLQEGDSERQFAVEKFVQLGFADRDSSRAAQLALEQASAKDAAVLVDGLRGRVWEAIQCKFANYLVQRIIEVMPAASVAFVADELRGYGVDVARHRMGCRILCRLIEHGALVDATSPVGTLVHEVLSSAHLLVRHTYGGFVVRHMVEFGLPHHQRRVVELICADIYRITKNKQGSRLIESALSLCSREDQQIISSAFLSDSDRFLNIAANQFGSHAVKVLLVIPGKHCTQAESLILQAHLQLEESKYGRHVVAAAMASSRMRGCAFTH